MSGLIKFPDSSSIGIHAMLYMAANSDRPVSQTEICKRFNVSEGHLAKVMQLLRKRDLIVSLRGPTGGFTLSKNAAEINLLEVHEAINGKEKPRYCILKEPKCPDQCCELGKIVGKMEEELLSFLAKAVLKDVANKVFSQ